MSVHVTDAEAGFGENSLWKETPAVDGAQGASGGSCSGRDTDAIVTNQVIIFACSILTISKLKRWWGPRKRKEKERGICPEKDNRKLKKK